ncbi:hypothetical protein DICPUDRAFT_94337 [Dictyostelium purpureum]|uniref:EF-hand domain-containing protein n=1 Tax=Dictyostelium purpureum TaxID=5786 RepID=F0ZIB6_DICPU|nr:uncharacterized protein DICPUDRAFT_94337 [Dictyostelium purpureum]EGC36330.1 hypothetical protein DICPUDRAFT_94337 [Dictyostelium purpureum]|eukprot:XP_003287145.1 hypothetical protein DICPUDRAFT_94337 [Dictyostelium purpureum]
MAAKKTEAIIVRSIQKALDDYDGNKDGKISWDEMCSVYRKDPDVGEYRCDGMTNSVFGSLGVGKDKCVTKDELRTYFKKILAENPSQ